MSTQLDTLRAFVAARPAAQPSGQRAHVVLVASGKGGTGTSTIAALLAAASARRGRETLLVDGGAAASSLVQLLGLAEAPEAGSLLRIGSGLVLASARTADAQSTAERTLRYRRLTASFTSYETVVIDAGATMDAVMLAASAAGLLLAVTPHDRVGITAAYALLKMVGQRFGTLPLGVLANRCDEAAGTSAWERITAGTDRFLGHAVGFAGAIPDDPSLVTAAEAGQPFDSTHRGAAAAAADDVIGRSLREHVQRPLSLIRN